jgi:TPP-dependent 2-oxoacid decarboxylase
VVVVCGSLPLKAVDQRLLMHHTPADVDGVNYQAVTLKDLLRAVIDVAEPVTGRQFARPAPLPVATNTAPSDGKLTQGEYWATIQEFVREGDVLIAEDGTANGGAWGLTLPPVCSFVAQAVWGSIGYSVGYSLGTPDRAACPSGISQRRKCVGMSADMLQAWPYDRCILAAGPGGPGAGAHGPTRSA